MSTHAEPTNDDDDNDEEHSSYSIGQTNQRATKTIRAAESKFDVNGRAWRTLCARGG